LLVKKSIIITYCVIRRCRRRRRRLFIFLSFSFQKENQLERKKGNRIKDVSYD